jgi:hypothetical protein
LPHSCGVLVMGIRSSTSALSGFLADQEAVWASSCISVVAGPFEGIEGILVRRRLLCELWFP